MLGAEITVKFKAMNLISEEDIASLGVPFEVYVKETIEEESLFGIVSDKFGVLSVKKIEQQDGF